MEDFICRHPDLLQHEYIDWIHSANSSINFVFSTLYNSDVWLTAEIADTVGNAGMTFLHNYTKLAQHFYKLKKPRFPIMPKFHYLHHCFHDLLKFALRLEFVLNPLVESNQMDEDPQTCCIYSCSFIVLGRCRWGTW